LFQRREAPGVDERQPKKYTKGRFQSTRPRHGAKKATDRGMIAFCEISSTKVKFNLRTNFFILYAKLFIIGITSPAISTAPDTAMYYSRLLKVSHRH
jgi:hypothetical protein